jgi:hypothetical protein
MSAFFALFILLNLPTDPHEQRNFHGRTHKIRKKNSFNWAKKFSGLGGEFIQITL